MKKESFGPQGHETVLSRVWLITQEADNLERRVGGRPVHKDLLYEYRDGVRVDEEGMSTLTFPVGYVIEHGENYSSSWESFDDDFEVKRNLIAYPIISGIQISNLEGKLLTIIDASFADKEQRESIKSIVRNTLWGFNHQQERKLEEMFKSAGKNEEQGV